MDTGGTKVALAALLVLAAACSGDDDGGDAAGDSDADSTATTEAAADEAALANPYENYTSVSYDGTTNWICHPDLADDECDDLSATELAADGSTRPADLEVAEDPPIDCFYVYPTTSTDPGTLADFAYDDSETSTVRAQAAPFASQCRVFAPAYRQVTIAALFAEGERDPEAFETAYGDVVDAWKTYISQHNEGRGVVLIGHSQGTGHLNALIENEIVGESALVDRLVSAILLGGGTTSFDGIPACETADEIGCFVAFVSFPAAAGPTEGSFFGNVDSEGNRAACVDPTELFGGDGLADSILPAGESLLGGSDLGLGDVGTQYVVVPDAVDLSCESNDEFDWLSVAIAPDQDATRLAPLNATPLGPNWGLHLLDANLAMGDLVEIVAAQSAAYTGG